MPVDTGSRKYQLSEKTIREWPELDREVAHMTNVEQPDLMRRTKKIRPMNWYEKFALKGADAITWPWGTIAMNKDAMKKNNSNLGDVLAHELTHIGQKSGILGNMRRMLPGAPSYLARPDEQEAFQAENERYKHMATRDIHLSSKYDKVIETGPSSIQLQKSIKEPKRKKQINPPEMFLGSRG